MKKFFNRYRIWKCWAAESNDSKFFKILVLFDLAECLAFESFRIRFVVRERVEAMAEFARNFAKTNKELDEEETEKED